MARFSLPANDARIHKEEELSLMRVASQRNANPRPSQNQSQVDGTVTPQEITRQHTPAETIPSPAPSRRHVVFADPVAFRYLEEDPCVDVVERKGVLRGYELYLVEQWACSRLSPTLVIVTYTGDERHSVVVGVLAIPEDESAWTPRLRVYFKAIQQYHARPKQTLLGELMVTNLSSFPSALTVISVPDGDIKKHRQEFIVNENLKRLGCSGRAGLTLSEPTAAAKAKFVQLYKTNEKIPFAEAVVELVKLCQVALFIFGKLDQEYIDGLLCDVTERAVGNWWTEFGAEYYNVEPTDGILGPTTVVALLGLLMGARNRLSYFGAPISKDVFDIDSTKRGIGYFQKYQKLERTRRLDRQTLHKLHGVTAKAAAGEGWGVQKAVKSTVTEIGGKRGELVLGMVSGRDKGGLGDIETLDLDRFTSLIHGERAKWLWFGKPKRTTIEHDRSIPDMSNLLFGKEDSRDSNAQSKKTQSMPLDEEVEMKRMEESPGVYSAPAPGSATSVTAESPEKDALRRVVLKSVVGKMSDARSGFGRIKDAVYSGGGLRGHVSRPSKDEFETGYPGITGSVLSGSSPVLVASPVPGAIGRTFTWKNKPDEYRDGYRKDMDLTSAPASIHPGQSETPPSGSRPVTRAADDVVSDNETKRLSRAMEIRNDIAPIKPSVVGLTADENELQGPALEAKRRLDTSLSHLHRRHSIAGTQPPLGTLNEYRWPRRLSFGDAEEAVLRWTELIELDGGEDKRTSATLEKQAQVAEVACSLYANILDIKQSLEPWVDTKIKSIEAINDHYARQQENLQHLYYQLTDEYQRAKQASQEIIGEERAHVTEAVKDVEVLVAKLEYEMNALVSRVQDVEDGVAQFELQVEAVEKRAEELKMQLETESWAHWAVRTLTGIGTGPNITQAEVRK
ncbi:uncharacterized protein BCR38DRAFT_356846 [Pseudomassariella vexata]|uniref:STB6-like N-terminal domain-containing protein n=1 Tax=Pseudomassariella vexata TaxID=1141098 RepID=A0A1Y2D8F1_9PEZI|nr:uncharacterized protein BCR38DRAFT_356846 [Pseudomassariella vexata]ORY55497.1 hypothetical protein BCR38DRAFT_356846 [Pseudomassariella vexata]